MGTSRNPGTEELLTVPAREFVKVGSGGGQRGKRINLSAALDEALNEELLGALAGKAAELLHVRGLLGQGARRRLQGRLRGGSSSRGGGKHGRGRGRVQTVQSFGVKFREEAASEAPLAGHLHEGKSGEERWGSHDRGRSKEGEAQLKQGR